MIIELNEENFNKETNTGLKLVDFYTPWCGYCIKQAPILEELSNNGFWIGKLDCDKHPKIAQEYDITGFPSFILFKNGKIAGKFPGFHTKSQLLSKLTAAL